MGDKIRVGWVGHPELGELECEVSTYRYPNNSPEPFTVSWAHGKNNPIVYCHSEQRYVWMSPEPNP